MSRVSLEPKNQEKYPEVCVGLDHVLGFFIQVFGPENEDGEDVVVVNKDALFDKLSQAELANLIQQYCLDNQRTRHAVNQICLDLDPAINIPN